MSKVMGREGSDGLGEERIKKKKKGMRGDTQR